MISYLKLKQAKKIVSIILSAALLTAATSCGSKEVVVKDYGDTYTQTSAEADTTATKTDAMKISKGTGQTLRERLGKEVEFKDNFAVKGTNITANISYLVPDIPYVNVYNMTAIDDGKNDEDDIVKSLFGNTAKKIEELSYTNATDYISLIHKYEEIKSNAEASETGNFKYNGVLGYFTIDSNFDEKFKWVDDKNLYIHMYEGEYNGMRYGLLLAYDYLANEKYIYLEPISIDEVFPESNYSTIIYKDKSNNWEERKELENSCQMNKDDAIAMASEFLEKKLLLEQNLNVVTSDSNEYLSSHGHTIANYIYTGTSVDRDSMTQILYTDSDILSAISSYILSDGGVNYQQVREQENTYQTYLDDKGISDTDINQTTSAGFNDDSLYSFIEKKIDNVDVEFDAHGYALYLGSCIADEKDKSGRSVNFHSTMNSGIIKITDKGILGVDLMLSQRVVDVVENVGLMSFDKIVEGVKEQLPNKLDVTKLSNPVPENLDVQFLELIYHPYSGKESDDNTKNFSYIPTWYICIGLPAYSEGGVAFVFVNAMDGEILDVQVYNPN